MSFFPRILRASALGVALIGASCCIAPAVASASQIRNIFDFSGFGGKAKELGEPSTALVPDGSGGFYGAGAGGAGSVFHLTPPTPSSPTWSEQTIHVFGSNGWDGAESNQLLVAPDGALYATTSSGGPVGDGSICTLNGYYGCGIVYRLVPPTIRGGRWTEEDLHTFSAEADGAYPYSALAAGPGGVLYGTTSFGEYAAGTVFAVYPSGKRFGTRFETLDGFNGTSDPGGYFPHGGVVADSAGALYGTTTQGGRLGGGVVFKLTPKAKTWTLTVLHEFHVFGYEGPNRGYQPSTTLLPCASGDFFGTTEVGGRQHLGVVFHLQPPAKPGEQRRYDVIHDFQVGNPRENEALIKDASGDLYGEEYGGSPNAADIVYKLTPSARNTEWPETVLHVFPRSEGNLFVHFGPSGILYGSTANGGGAGAGSIFELMP